jgi:hypothetical protein
LTTLALVKTGQLCWQSERTGHPLRIKLTARHTAAWTQKPPLQTRDHDWQEIVWTGNAAPSYCRSIAYSAGDRCGGKRRSPQEKKGLSYSKDRRNWYGENDKSSRKNIARNKRNRHRSERHRQQQLAAALGPVDEVVETGVDERLARARRGSRWRKFPDAQLGLYVAGKLAKRVDKGISAARTEQARIEKVLRNTEIDGLELRRKRR